MMCIACPALAMASDVEDLAKQTGINLGLVSSKLAEHQKKTNDMYAKRIDIITSVERLAAEGRYAVDRELAVLKLTGGANVAKLLNVLHEDANQVAAAPAQFSALEDQTRKDATASVTPLSISTDKIDSAAKNLGTLAKGKSHKEWLEFMRDYFKDTREDIDKLQADGAKSKQGGDDAMSAQKDAAKQGLSTAMKKFDDRPNVGKTP
jgi:hypothetical protein